MGEGFRASVSFCSADRDGDDANRALELSEELEEVLCGDLLPGGRVGRGREDREAAVFSCRISRGFLVSAIEDGDTELVEVRVKGSGSLGSRYWCLGNTYLLSESEYDL